MNSPFKLRPLDPETDLPRLLRLHTEVEASDQGGAPVSEETLRQQMSLPGHNPAQDRWVVEAPDDPDRLLGSALVWIAPSEGERLARCNVTIHPDWRRQGLGRALMARVLGRARTLGAGQASVSAAAKVPAASAFLIQHGFTAAGAYTELRASTDIRLPNPVWPYGYQLRTYAEVNDIAILTEAMNRCYEGLWGHNDVSREQMAEWLPEFTPEGLFLVFSHSGKVVGISRVECSAERSARNGASTGYIDAPGLTPQHRRNDLYRALLITGLRWLQSQGQKLVELESWGDRPDLLEMYGEFGFTVLRKLVTYERSLQGMV